VQLEEKKPCAQFPQVSGVQAEATGPVSVSAMVAVRVFPPPVAVRVSVALPAGAVPELTVSVTLPAPPATEEALSAAVTPAGAPETESATAELKPPDDDSETCTAPLLLAASESEDGLAESRKSGVLVVVLGHNAAGAQAPPRPAQQR
jgi:hypothetical protein